MRCVLGVDIGTQGCKGVLVSARGEILATASTTHAVSTPAPGWAEHDAESLWWGGFREITSALLDRVPCDASDIAAIGISALIPVVVPVDANLRPLRPAILYHDLRAEDQLHRMNAALAASGGPTLVAHDLGPKLLWLREHDLDGWAATSCFLTAQGFVAARLTGARTVDRGAALGFRPFVTPMQDGWQPEVCATYGLPLDRLPQILDHPDIVGTVTTAAASETGLAPGTPVIAGLTDFYAEIISSGAHDVGDVVVSYGTTMCASVLTRRERPWDPHRDGPTFHLGRLADLTPGIEMTSTAMATSGAILRWFRDEFAAEERRIEAQGGPSAYAQLDAEAATIAPGSDGLIFLPYFNGERSPIFDEHARGILLGLTLTHRRSHIYRAILEGIAFGLEHQLEPFRQRGAPLTRIFSSGGGSASPVWTQIVSDVTGLPQRVIAPSNAACGAAFVAGHGVGIFPTLAEIGQWHRTFTDITPNLVAHRTYQKMYAIYRSLYPSTRDAMHALHDLAHHRDGSAAASVFKES